MSFMKTFTNTTEQSIRQLNKLAFDPQLTPGARNAVRVCLRVQPSETVTVITDEVSLEIAAAIVHELEEVGCRYQTWVLEDVATRPLTDLPLAIAEDLESSQVSIFAVQAQTNELKSRMQMTDVVNRQKIRHAHMVNINKRIMLEGMRADFQKVDRLKVKGNRLIEAHSANKELKDDFWAYTHKDENSNRVGEFAIGTNIELKDVIGEILQDEKYPGVHIAFGNPYGAHTGAEWYSSTHIDVVGRNFDIWVDGEQIMRKGQFLIEA